MLTRTWVFLAVLAGLTTPAAASPQFLSRLIGQPFTQGESFACFSRQYDAAHLNAHPNQRVTFVKALIAAYFRESSFTPGQGSFMYQISLAFRFRDRPETLTSVAECGDGKPADSLRGGAYCAGPGKGPSHLTLDGRDVVLLSMPGGADLWAPGPIDKRHDTVANPFGPDDQAFRLVRTEVRACEDLAFDRWKPLRPHEP